MSARIDGSSIVSLDTYRAAARPAGNASDGKISPVTAPRGADTVSLTEDAVRLSALDKTLSGIPTVNQDRVAALKAAVAEGRYVIDPEAIATQMSHLEWQLQR